jgi:hypothetical protein
LVGDDWLGADWVYVSLTQYGELDTGKDGTPLVKIDRETGEQYYTFTNHRFWADPGVAHLNPGYTLWVWGEETAPGEFQATEIQVKPPATAKAPDDVAVSGFVDSQDRFTVLIKDFNDTEYIIQTDEATAWNFPPGEAAPRPEEGRWANIAWLTGPGGLLGSYAEFHSRTQGMVRMDFGFSWKLAPGQPVSSLLVSRLGNTILLMTTAILLSLVIGIPIGIYSAVNQYSKTDLPSSALRCQSSGSD